MFRTLPPGDPGKIAAGAGAWLGAGVVLVSAGMLIGALMSGLLVIPFISHARIGLVPQPAGRSVPGHHHLTPVPPPAALPAPRPPSSPPPALVVLPRHHPPAPLVSPHRRCQRRECKRPGDPLPARAALLSSRSVPVPSLTLPGVR